MASRHHAWILAIFLVGGSASTARAADDPASVLRASADAYAALKSYRDVGVVVPDDGPDIRFDTAYARPDRFRFAWESGHPYILLRFEKITEVLRSEGARVTTWEQAYGKEPTVRTDASLASGVAGATGVSRGAAHTIATLLMPHLWDGEAFGASVLAMEHPRLMTDESIDGVPCRHLSGLAPKGRPLDVWIGVRDHLVRRVDTRFGSFGFSELRRDVRIDEAIPDTVFAKSSVAQ